jgi:hypothetical protein
MSAASVIAEVRCGPFDPIIRAVIIDILTASGVCPKTGLAEGPD